MRRKRAVCGGADHRGEGPKCKVSDPYFVQKFLNRGISHYIWRQLMTKQRHLALGVLPRVIDRDLPCSLETKLPAEEAKELRRTMRLEPGPSRIGLVIEHSARLGEHVLLEHDVEPCLDPRPQPGAIGSQQDGLKGPRRRL